MSLILSESTPNVTVKTEFFDNSVNIYYRGETSFDIDIPYEDFCCLVEYVFTNTDLKDLNDPRLKMLLKLRNYHLREGYKVHFIKLRLILLLKVIE